MGEWLQTPNGTLCSECNEYVYNDGDFLITNWHSAFCPHCGKPMMSKIKCERTAESVRQDVADSLTIWAERWQDVCSSESDT